VFPAESTQGCPAARHSGGMATAIAANNARCQNEWRTQILGMAFPPTQLILNQHYGKVAENTQAYAQAAPGRARLT